ncbi:hypothetical protein BGX24_004051, partial [Mortierella sp. AD032]
MPPPALSRAIISSPPPSHQKRQLSDVPSHDNSDNNNDHDYSQQIIKTFDYNPDDINSIIDF